MAFFGGTQPGLGGTQVRYRGERANPFNNPVLRDVQTVDDWFTLVPFVAFFPRIDFDSIGPPKRAHSHFGGISATCQ